MNAPEKPRERRMMLYPGCKIPHLEMFDDDEDSMCPEPCDEFGCTPV